MADNANEPSKIPDQSILSTCELLIWLALSTASCLAYDEVLRESVKDNADSLSNTVALGRQGYPIGKFWTNAPQITTLDNVVW